MIIEDEESLRMYVDESFEHMSNIESNLLEIEKAGDQADEELLNEVFRAAHSIKGGAGLMGLNKIKELSHKVENVLGMVREKEIYPDSTIISIVLAAFDKLHHMISNIKESEDFDISEEVVSLTGLTTASLPAAKKPSVTNELAILSPADNSPLFITTQFDLEKARKGGRVLYIIELDLMADIHDQEKVLMDMMKSVSSSGDVLDSRMDIDKVGTLEESLPSRLPFFILFSSLIGEDILPTLFGVSKNQVYRITDSLIQPVDESDLSSSSIPRDETTTASRPAVGPDSPPRQDDSPDTSLAATPAARPDTTGDYSGDYSGDTTEDAAETDDHISDTARTYDQNKDLDAESAGAKAPSNEEPPETAPPGSPNTLAETLKDASLKSAMKQTSLRVDVKLLDSLMTLAGEMVLSRNQLLQSIAADDIKTIGFAGQRINMVTSELQDVIMRTRMQSIGNIFNKFPRLVRDMSQNLGKKVELTLEGTDVELDKTIIEAISDPLTHLVRNSVDHGIEPPGKRKNSDKSPIGKIRLSAFHEAGQVSIEINDDGRGIDGEAIAAAAVQKGLISEHQAGTMTKKEKIELILLPGFSTSEQVTDLSGRGVGMDVVKTNLEKLGGTMDIDSEPGRYTSINIKLPLTLAIIPSQIVLVGDETFAIPQVNLDELLRIPAEQVKHRIEKVGDAEVVRLRGKLLPLVDLAEVLNIEKQYLHPRDGQKYQERRQSVADRRSRKLDLPSEGSGGTESAGKQSDKTDTGTSPENIPTDLPARRSSDDRRFHATSAINIAVVFMGDIKYGLIVDRLLDSEEIVVKPLGQHLKACQEFSGATIMGDGKVALILDVAGVANAARLSIMEISRKEKAEKDIREAATTKTSQEATSLLLFSNTDKEQFAVSLSLVERIESVRKSTIEHVGGKKIMQYRGGALPLFSLDNVANVLPLPDAEELEVIVFTIGGKEIGLMVIPPVDAVEVPINIDSKALKQPGIMGSAIINQQTTLILDIFEAVQTLYPQWMGDLTQRQIKNGVSGTLLFAEDSDFFRRQVKGFLEDGGFNIIEAKDGQEAWDILQKQSGEIDLIITDIEMPKMNGFELTEKIRNDERYNHYNVIALTSLAGEEDVVKGKQAGINDYQIKMDREKLLDSVKRHLKK